MSFCPICVFRCTTEEFGAHMATPEHAKNAAVEAGDAKYKTLKDMVLEMADGIRSVPKGPGFVEQTLDLQVRLAAKRDELRATGTAPGAVKEGVLALLAESDKASTTGPSATAAKTPMQLACAAFQIALDALESHATRNGFKVPWRVRYCADTAGATDNTVTFEGGVITDADGNILWTTLCDACGVLIQRGSVGVGVPRRVCLDSGVAVCQSCDTTWSHSHPTHLTVTETDDNTFLHIKALTGVSMGEIAQCAMETYGSRPAIGTIHTSEARVEWTTFTQLHGYTINVATHMASKCVGPDVIIGISSQNRVENMVVDIAACFRHFVSIGVHTTLTQAEAEEVITHAGVTHVFCDAAQMPRFTTAQSRCPSLVSVVCMDTTLLEWMAAPVPGAADPVLRGPWTNCLSDTDKRDIFTVIYTSGSSGRPKGVAVPESCFRYDVSHPLKVFPLVGVSFIPLSHSTDRMRVWESLLNGGRVAMAHYAHRNWEDHELHAGAERFKKLLGATLELRDNGTLELLADVALVHPTIFIAPPRIWKGMELFLRNVGIARVQEMMGRRVHAIATGGGPTADATFAFTKELFPNLDLIESYGATEVGGIAIVRDAVTKRMAVMSDVVIVLDEIPELGIVRPLGEARVRSTLPGMRARYWNNPVDTAAAFVDVDGHTWFRSGDICEGEWDGGGVVTSVRVVERKKNYAKMVDGTVLLPDTIETILEAVAAVRHVCVVPMSSLDGFAVIVNPATSDVTVDTIRTDVERVLTEAGMRGPKLVLVDPDPWQSSSNLRQQGTLTVSLKPNRRVIVEKFAQQLSSVPRSQSPQFPPPASTQADLIMSKPL